MSTQIGSLRLRRLKSQWFLVAAGCGLVWVVSFLLLQWAWGARPAMNWLGVSAVGAGYLLWVLWRGLPENRPLDGGALFPTLGAANLLTVLRGLAVAALMGFLLRPWPEGFLRWIPGALFLFGVSLDYVDGYVARTTQRVSRLGERLDMSQDGFSVLVGTLLGLRYGQLPWWYLPVGLARLSFLAGLAWRQRRNLPVFDLPSRASRRALAGGQMGLVAVVLFPIFSPPGTHVVATVFMLPFLAGFLRDWILAVRGHVPWAADRILGFRPANLPWIPVLLRLFAVSLLGGLLFAMIPSGPPAAVPLANSVVSPGWMVAWALVLIGMLLMGLAGRVAALGAMLFGGVRQAQAGINAEIFLLLIVAAMLFFTGPGSFSLWRPEERVITHRPGDAGGV